MSWPSPGGAGSNPWRCSELSSFWNSTGENTEVQRVWGGQNIPPVSLGALGAVLHPIPKTMAFFLGSCYLGVQTGSPVSACPGGAPLGDTPSLQEAGQDTDELAPKN